MSRRKWKRTIVYIDGYNLYYGIRAKKFTAYKWLNLYELGRRLKPPHTKLVGVKYFTSYIGSPPERHRRQINFIEALETLTPIKVFRGNYRGRPQLFTNADGTVCEHKVYREKKTDVNLATEMVVDVCLKKCEALVLVCGDTDMLPAIEKIKNNFPKIKIIIAFPPYRIVDALKPFADHSFEIGTSLLKRCLLPAQIRRKDGYLYKKPKEWL